MSDTKCALCPEDAAYEYAGQNLCSSCVSSEAAKTQTPEVPKKKRVRHKEKKIKEIETKDIYSGEASPYWNDAAQQHWQSENNQLTENAEANPDVLPETATPYAYTRSEDEELRADVLRDVMEQLTPLQLEALTLCDAPDYTEERSAIRLGLTRLAFRTIIERIKNTIETKIAQRQKSARWQK